MIEAEYAVIGGAIIDDELRSLMLNKLEDKHFNSPVSKEIFNLMAASEEVDQVVVYEALGKDSGVMDKVMGAMEGATGLNEQTYSAYLSIVIANWQKLQTQAIANDTYAQAVESKDAQQLIGESIERLESLVTQDEQTTFTAKEFAKATLQNIDDRLNHDGDLFGLSTGWKSVDDKTGGLDVGSATCIAGRPGSGKTTAALNIAEHNAIRAGKKVLFLNLEMDEVELGRRSIASLGKVDLSDMKNPKEVVDQQGFYAGITSAVNMLNEAADRFKIVNCHGATTQKIMQIIKTEWRNMGGFDLLVVDYIGLVNVGENRATGLGHLVKSIRNFSKKKFHSILLSQVNRACESRPDKRPISADLRESGDIEQDMDNIIMVYRDEVYNEDSEFKGTVELIGRKSRHGTTGTNVLATNMAQSRFYEMSRNGSEI